MRQALSNGVRLLGLLSEVILGEGGREPPLRTCCSLGGHVMAFWLGKRGLLSQGSSMCCDCRKSLV